MNFTEKAKSKFWYDLSEGINATFGHKLGESFHIDQYKEGRFTFTESVTGGPGAVTLLMDKLKASSPVIESVRMTPISNGYNATYNVSVEFDPVKAESVYSDGKNNVKSFEKDGKKYMVDDEGNAIEVDDPDKFVDNLNKSTGSRYQKKSEGSDILGKLKELESITDAGELIDAIKALGLTEIEYGDSGQHGGKSYAVFKGPHGEYAELEYNWKKLDPRRDSLVPDEVESYNFYANKQEYEDDHGYSPRESKKSESNLDEDGFPIDLDSVVALANEALDGTGASIAQEDGNLVIRGEADAIKPTQQYLPEPSYDMDSLEGGYDEETGDLSVAVPDYPSDIELEQLREFLINAVNYIIDNTLCKSDNCSDEEWCEEMANAEPNEKYATQYSYKGDSFVGESKHKVAVLVKSLLNEGRVDEAKQVATKHMGAEMAEGFARKYAVEKVEEKHSAVITDEMAVLDRLHETAMERSPEKIVEMDSLVAKNMFKN